MQYSKINVTALMGLAAVVPAFAQTSWHTVEVGKGGLSFEPDTITAKVGDHILFHFNSYHSVVAGDFSKPCAGPVSESDGGLWTDFRTKGYWSYEVKTTDPIFLYCSLNDHCQDGMVAVINEGSDKLSSYKSAAMEAEENVSPDTSAYGGVFDSSMPSQTMMTSSMSTSESATATSTSSMAMSTDTTAMSTDTTAMTTDTAAMTTTMSTTEASSTESEMSTTVDSAEPTTTTGAAAPGAVVAGLAIFMAGMLAV